MPLVVCDCSAQVECIYVLSAGKQWHNIIFQLLFSPVFLHFFIECHLQQGMRMMCTADNKLISLRWLRSKIAIISITVVDLQYAVDNIVCA